MNGVHELDFLNFSIDFSSPATVSAYDEVPLWSAMFGLLLLEEVPLLGVRRALDVACGTGFPLIELAERLGPDCEVHGVDVWTQALARAAEKLRVRGVRNVTLHETSATTLPFPDGHFDLVVSNLGVNNFDDRVGAVRECFRVLGSGGTMALTTNVVGHMREFYEAFAAILRDEEDPTALARLDEHIAHRATASSVRDLLADSGFIVTRVVEREESMRFASGRALFHHYFIKLGFLDGWKGVVEEDRDRIFKRMVERLDARAREEIRSPSSPCVDP